MIWDKVFPGRNPRTFRTYRIWKRKTWRRMRFRPRRLKGRNKKGFPDRLRVCRVDACPGDGRADKGIRVSFTNGRRTSLVIGTRGSQLALWQAEWVQARLQEIAPSVSIRLQRIRTSGDKILDVPLAKIGGKGLFVKEIEEALSRGDIDLAVHSMKDVPSVLPEGLAIVCVPVREDARDALLTRDHVAFRDLPGRCEDGNQQPPAASPVVGSPAGPERCHASRKREHPPSKASGRRVRCDCPGRCGSHPVGLGRSRDRVSSFDLESSGCGSRSPGDRIARG